MSKHIWRGHSAYTMVHEKLTTEPSLFYRANCTVVGDSACFPVKEAMRLCSVMASFNYGLDSWARMDTAKDKYVKAVAKLKAKKAVRK